MKRYAEENLCEMKNTVTNTGTTWGVSVNLAVVAATSPAFDAVGKRTFSSSPFEDQLKKRYDRWGDLAVLAEKRQ